MPSSVLECFTGSTIRRYLLNFDSVFLMTLRELPWQQQAPWSSFLESWSFFAMCSVKFPRLPVQSIALGIWRTRRVSKQTTHRGQFSFFFVARRRRRSRSASYIAGMKDLETSCLFCRGGRADVSLLVAPREWGKLADDLLWSPAAGASAGLSTESLGDLLELVCLHVL